MNTEFILRLFIAGILGSIIGLDREYRAKEAGYRTHFLVSLGSALIMIVSQHGFSEILDTPNVNLDPSRIASQVVTGIGFIGAGTIILHKQIDSCFFGCSGQTKNAKLVDIKIIRFPTIDQYRSNLILVSSTHDMSIDKIMHIPAHTTQPHKRIAHDCFWCFKTRARFNRK
jgi:hypothetical protein